MSAKPEFSHEHARAYDDRWKALAPTMQGLHFLSGIVLSHLPVNAHILCVGAGTGAEILTLADKFPHWRFTAVDPAGDMLAICKKKMEERGYQDRCVYHVGYLDTLKVVDEFDGATAFLVSHFITDSNERRKFFNEIFIRLKAGALLINADLTRPQKNKIFDLSLESWVDMLKFAGITDTSPKKVAEGWQKNVALSTATEMEWLLEASGFDDPVAFYQSLFIRAWVSKKES